MVVILISANYIFTIPNESPMRPKHVAMATKGAAVDTSTCVLVGYYLPHCKYLFLFTLIFFQTSHLGTYHGNGKSHVQYASSSNLQLV